MRTAPSESTSETTLHQSPVVVEPELRNTFYTEKQLCKQLPNCSLRKLSYWRQMRVGPPWSRIGREIVYLRESVAEWIKKNEIELEREQQRSARRGAK